MNVDRCLQKDILSRLRNAFPESIRIYIFNRVYDGNVNFGFNVMYLVGHGLIDADDLRGYKITSKGIDFLEDDGGLSAILNTVTVKFDAENIRALMEEGLLKANISQENKDGILAKLRTLPGKALETVTLELIKKALANPAEALSVIRTALAPMGITF